MKPFNKRYVKATIIGSLTLKYIMKMMNYKRKRFLVWIGFYRITHWFKNKKKSKDQELSDIQKHFIAIWKQKVHKRENEIYKTKSDIFDVHFIIDNKEGIALKMVSNNEFCNIELYSMLDNMFYQCITLPENIKNRFVESFDYEVSKRCSEMENKINILINNNLTEVSQ